MIDMLATAVVFLTGLYLVVLGVAAFVAPNVAARFLLGHAGSAAAHYAELLVRLIVGGALLLTADSMQFPAVFSAIGWVLLITAAGLLLVPWQWHRRFAQRFVPQAVRHLKLLGAASLVFGGSVLCALQFGSV
mgnify:FL=1